MTGVSRRVTRSASLAEDEALTEATRAVVQRCHEAWARRDAAGVLACYHPAIEYFDFFQNLVLTFPDLQDYVSRSMPSGPASYLHHRDRIRADGDTAFIQYEITVPVGSGIARFNASEAVTVRDGLIWRIREYATLSRTDSPGSDTAPVRPPAQKLGLSARQLSQLAADLDAYFDDRKPYLDPALDLPRVARETGYTRNQISFLLNQVLGVSFYHYVTQKRLAQVRAALDGGDRGRIDALAYAAGFNSLSAFYRAFRQETGLSPHAYRKDGPTRTEGDA